jgi:alginate O-acetyltransferase complex protein AlgJ
MKNQNNLPAWKAYYNWGFVILFTIFLGSMMFLSLQQGYEQFANNFYQKGLLISNFNRLRMKIGDRVFPQVLVGENGWLEYSVSGELDAFQNFSGPDSHLLRIQQKLNALNERLKQQNTTLILIVAPDKVTIYPDKIPGEIKKVGEKSQLDRLVELMGKSNSPILLDLRPALLEGRKSQQLYYKTDTHWNGLGGFIAYQQVMQRISLTYPDLQPFNLNNFNVKENKPTIMDLSKIMGIDFLKESYIALNPKFSTDVNVNQIFGFTPEGNNMSMTWAKGNGQNKTLIMYHDSFGTALKSLLQYHFKEATYILINSNPLDTSWVYRQKPDILIIEIIERNLGALVMYLSNE